MKVLLAALLPLATAFAQSFMQQDFGVPAGVQLPGLKNAGIDQKLSNQIPLDLSFRDDSGRATRLAEYYRGKPVILAPVYYGCPMLCMEILNGLVRSLRAVSLDAGRDFTVLAASFDPSDTPEQARRKKDTYVKRYGRAGTEGGWHFLTGGPEAIKMLTEAMGFRYQYDPRTRQFAHASGILITTPEGKISHYFYGIDYSARDVRLGLVEASANRIGTPVDQLLLYCYHYDPVTGKYGALAMNMLRLAAALTLVVLGAFLIVMFRRERQQSRERKEAAAGT